MKKSIIALIVLGSLASSFAVTTIHTANKFAYGANIGWMDWRGDTNSGAVIGEYVCSGYIYSANVGWISLGSGSPANLVQYQNISSNDFGVNHDGVGNLRGYAYGANIGWINFENTGAAKVDLSNGRLSGSIYSANCGWISLSNSVAFVQTTNILRGTDSDLDGLTDAWEILNFSSLTNTPAADGDGDGMNNLQEYQAGTNPNDAADSLRITSYTHGIPTPTYNTLLWTTKPTRFYALQYRPTLDPVSPFTDYVVFQNLGANNVGFDVFGEKYFFRIRAFRPLTQ
ncbi:MAG: thrombospondin type 3 repeat-containing protein [Verrucomicrobiota bacterium]